MRKYVSWTTLSIVGSLIVPSLSAATDTSRVVQGNLWVLVSQRQSGNRATVTYLDETHPMFLRNGHWEAPLAIYARTKPGLYTATLREDGKVTARIPFEVVKKSYPTQSIKMPKSKTGLQSPDILHRERVILDDTFKDTTSEPLWRGAFVKPIPGASVSSDFGNTRYVNGKFWSQHGGLDLRAPMGKITVASNNGRVILARKLWMRGNTLAIDHGMGVISVYNHLSAFLVKEGDRVRKGQAVGKVGATGFVTGPHLHWEIRAAGTPTNPWPLFQRGITLP